MKLITRKLSHIELASFVTLIFVSIGIWVIGPHLLIAHDYPLVGPEKRFSIILLLFLGWLLFTVIFSVESDKPTLTFTPSPEALKKLHALQGRFQGAIEFLKKTIITKQSTSLSLAHLPWYLMIGPHHSGKTTLLANANINFILSKQFKPELLKAMPPSEACDWWATRDLVLVDVPSSYLYSSNNTEKTNVLWHNLLHLIQDHRKAESLNGIIVTLNLPEWMQQANQQKKLILNIKQRISELKTCFGNKIPCYFIITKADLIPGFLDFFSDSSSEELMQMWGVTLPALRSGDKLSELVTHRFNALIKRLNKQLLWRLHKERSAQARALIKDFPLHIERIKDHMVQFIKILSMPDLRLNGIFFTSSIQPITHKEPTTHHTSLAVNANPYQALQILQPTTAPNKPYFVRQLLTQALFHNEHQATEPETAPPIIWPQWATYTASISIITLTTIFLMHDFRQGIQQTNLIQSNLAQYQSHLQQNTSHNSRLINGIALLDTLQQASNSENSKLSSLIKHLAFYSKKSQQTAEDVYAKALQAIVLPEIKNTMENYLQETNDKNSTQVYAVLKAYLMLADTDNRQLDFITSTVKKLLPVALSPETEKQLNSHIVAAFNLNQKYPLLNNQLITSVRKQLTSLPSNDLAYIILKNRYDNNVDSPIKLGTDPKNASVFVSKQLANQIPNMFTADKFNAIISRELSTAATEALQGNWIIGTIITSSVNPLEVAEQLRNQYITNYVDIWESQLANIKLNAPKTLPELKNMLSILTGSNSPLLQMLQTIQKNTAFDAITNASPKLQAFDALLANANHNQDNYLYQMFLNLRELNKIVQTITQANDAGSAAFQITKQHIQNAFPDNIAETNAAQKAPSDALTNINTLTQQISEPMKTWLSTLSTQTWSLISNTAAHYVDNAWQKEIMSTYHSQMIDRFPFSHNAKQDVNISLFSRFMGQQGILTSFYQTYLKPFVDDSQKTEWHWRTVDNQALPFKNEILKQFQQLTKIQKAFFPNGDNQLYVQFTLQPISLEPTIKNFNLAINGQQIHYQKNDINTPHVFSWPGNNNITHATTLNFVTLSNQLVTETFQGDWGWLRLIEKATQKINSHKEITLNFAIDGHSAQYLLFTEGHLNPFLSANLENLQLPETLIG